MINILIPLAGKNQFFPEAEYPFPKSIIEINGKTMIEHVLDNFSSIKKDKQYIFIVNGEDCKKFHLDNVLNLLTESKCQIVRLDAETKGAACSALMAVEFINNDDELIVSNADQIIDETLENILFEFSSNDAGVISFDSVHPKWSYCRIGKDGKVTEAAEKRPISKNAIAGFYYFKHGKDFVNGAMEMIRKDANVNGKYFIAPVLNELILKNKVVGIAKVENSKYHTFYSPTKIAEYERSLKC